MPAPTPGDSLKAVTAGDRETCKRALHSLASARKQPNALLRLLACTASEGVDHIHTNWRPTAQPKEYRARSHLCDERRKASLHGFAAGVSIRRHLI
jgi:hypothetical protein